jgi:hypothetical protein
MRTSVIILSLTLYLHLSREGYDLPKIVDVTPNDDHTLLIELDNHHRIIYDIRSRLQTTRFCGLADIQAFKSVRVKHENTLVWNNMCQITIDEIIDMVDR